ncbi:hypothetical protein [Devosia sp. FJ2-5-3]|jgi:ferric-dicitrate binding protein FerR (iron transport regulator)|uniref:hypothetical protein n=1 Tax=Devosia sp. FJ2-5-3 TaxID=2976680 RepID=UPI0023D7ED8E|nr:hypothetical protein [Devosia sp. FJ2-5-3]WEJ57737.1 hypothetical protein N0P34_16270 [Devosia sp. FJ2-5-3]
MASHTDQLPAGNPSPVAPSPSRRRARSIALAAALLLFAVTFYVLTLVKMGPALFDRML